MKGGEERDNKRIENTRTEEKEEKGRRIEQRRQVKEKKTGRKRQDDER